MRGHVVLCILAYDLEIAPAAAAGAVAVQRGEQGGERADPARRSAAARRKDGTRRSLLRPLGPGDDGQAHRRAGELAVAHARDQGLWRVEIVGLAARLVRISQALPTQ